MAKAKIDFLKVAKSDKSLSKALYYITQWMDSHERIRTLSAERISHFVKHNFSEVKLEEEEIQRALEALAANGDLQKKIAMKDPSGVLLAPYYDSLEEVPERVPNRFEDYWYESEQLDHTDVFQLTNDS